jgi:hypothetical protein
MMFGLFSIALKGLLLPLHSKEQSISSSFLFDSWWSEFPGYFIALSLSFQLLFLMLCVFSVRMGCSFSYWWSKLPTYFIALWFSFHSVFLKLVFFLLLPGFNGFLTCFARLSFFHCTLDNIRFCSSHFGFDWLYINLYMFFSITFWFSRRG